MDEERIKATESGMLFFDLLILLRDVVRTQLGLVIDPITGDTVVNLEAARHATDMISVLEQKTQGNVTEQEQQVLQNLISELRIACVRAEKAEKEAKIKEGGDDEGVYNLDEE